MGRNSRNGKREKHQNMQWREQGYRIAPSRCHPAISHALSTHFPSPSAFTFTLTLHFHIASKTVRDSLKLYFRFKSRRRRTKNLVNPKGRWHMVVHWNLLVFISSPPFIHIDYRIILLRQEISASRAGLSEKIPSLFNNTSFVYNLAMANFKS